MAVSLPFLVVYSLLISAVLIWLNRRGVGGVGALGTLTILFWVFTEVNAPPLDEETARHHAPIGWAERSPI